MTANSHFLETLKSPIGRAVLCFTFRLRLWPLIMNVPFYFHTCYIVNIPLSDSNWSWESHELFWVCFFIYKVEKISSFLDTYLPDLLQELHQLTDITWKCFVKFVNHNALYFYCSGYLHVSKSINGKHYIWVDWSGPSVSFISICRTTCCILLCRCMCAQKMGWLCLRLSINIVSHAWKRKVEDQALGRGLGFRTWWAGQES